MDQLRPPAGTVARWVRRLGLALTTWPTRRGWFEAAVAGAATLTVLGAVGLATGLYAPRSANLAGLPWRLLTVLFVPAIGEEAVFRGLLIPGRAELARPAGPLCLATGIFVGWHVVEAQTFLPMARPLFDRPDFLACAGILGLGCGWIRWRTGSLWPAVGLHWVMVNLWQTWFGGFTL
jgi:predicted Abi (CAAX) family protease